LNLDVIILVVYHLYDVDPQSVKSLALVCSTLYSMARYVQHRELSIDVSKDNISKRLRFVTQNGLLPTIRTLHVYITERFENYTDNRSPISGSKSQQERLKVQLAAWKQLGDLVPEMLGLRDLHWTGAAIPDPVLDYLGKNPKIHLHLSLQAGDHSSYHDMLLARLKQLSAKLAGTHNLSSLRIKLVYTSATTCRLITQVPLRQLLLSSPRLRALSLDIAYPHSGCVEFGPERDYCGFGLSNGEILPPLEELEVIEYPWGQQPSVSGWQFNCLGYPEPTGTEMEYWAQNLDWSQLRRLRLHDSSVLLATHLAPQLTALEEIELNSLVDHYNTQVPTFFNMLPSTLKSITLSSLPPSGILTITAHAAKLRALSIHHSPLSNQDLLLLQNALPYLETLTLVCTRDSATWPHDALSILAGFPRLESLTIWFDIGPVDAPDKPYLTLSSTGDIFTHLRQHGASRLRRLHAHSGFPPQPFHGFPSDQSYWPESNMTSFICQGDGDISPEVSCPRLSRAQNERLRRVARGECMTQEETNNMYFLVALRGPMNMEKWLSWRNKRGISWDTSYHI
jgi:hypothetical protein